MAVRALAFDVFGTLVDWRSGVSEAFRTTGLDADPEELADDWRARYRPILEEVNEGSRPWGDFDELHLVTLGELLAERALDLDSKRFAPITSRRRCRTATRLCSSTSHATATCASTASSPPSSPAPTSRRPRSTEPAPGCSGWSPPRS
jgi:hypothetical protein